VGQDVGPTGFTLAEHQRLLMKTPPIGCLSGATNWGERQEFGSRGSQAVRAFCRPLPSPMWAKDENGRQGRALEAGRDERALRRRKRNLQATRH
jgi:hypothetical protein